MPECLASLNGAPPYVVSTGGGADGRLAERRVSGVGISCRYGLRLSMAEFGLILPLEVVVPERGGALSSLRRLSVHALACFFGVE